MPAANITGFNWDKDASLKLGKCRTRDGRVVFNLKQVFVEGKEILIGHMQAKKITRNNQIVHCEQMWWDRTGLGYGPNDLVNY